jgi:predicted SnoaL-like aldol condensation-catalyzing enzyme
VRQQLTKEIEMPTFHRSRVSVLAIVALFAGTLFAAAVVNVHASSTSDVEANTALVLRYQQEIFEQGKMATADEILAPTFICHNPTDQSLAVGPEAVTQRATALHAFYSRGIVLTADDVIAQGDRVAVRWTMVASAPGEARDVPVTVTGMNIFRIQDGQLAEMWEYGDPGMQQSMSANWS